MVDPERCSRTWIQTYSGRQFWPLAPRAADLFIPDIAHALAMKCRFTGHSKFFYSVAQHSVLVSRAVPPADAFWGLMHDAAEAYLPDVAKPVKRQLAGFDEIEDRVMRVIAERYALPWPMPESVKAADVRLLATERRDLMAEPPVPWTQTENVEPLPDRIRAASPTVARRAFLRRFRELAPGVS